MQGNTAYNGSVFQNQGQLQVLKVYLLFLLFRQQYGSYFQINFCKIIELNFRF